MSRDLQRKNTKRAYMYNSFMGSCSYQLLTVMNQSSDTGTTIMRLMHNKGLSIAEPSQLALDIC
jgi:ATP-dependent Clp protease adapter protein ClpS